MKSPVDNIQASSNALPVEHTGIRPRSPSTMRTPACDVLVLDGRARQSLATVRSLGSRGLRVAILETCDGVPAFASRWCAQKYICPADEGTEAYLTYLEQVLDETRARVLITASDGTIELIRRYRERLEQRVHIALAQEPGLGIAINKEQTLAIASRLGLGVPQGITIRDGSEVDMAVREIGLPAVIKPVVSWLAGEEQSLRVACHLVTTPEEARRAVAELTGSGGAVLFQQFLTGRRESMSFFYANGTIYARFAQLVKRTDPPLGGTDVLRRSIAIPADVGKQAERLVREIDLEGYCLVEFRRDSAGKPYLMEINSRLSAGIELAVRAGVDFPYLLYQWANGEPINVVSGYRTGTWMRFLWGDVSATAASVRQRGRPGVTPPARALLDFCTSFFVPMQYDYLDWRDPLPVGTAIVNRARGGMKHLKNAFPALPRKEEAHV
jgi:predicted ATP-grasp superfamily ATP-dependent carboligase